jgi:hypothetical protein
MAKKSNIVHQYFKKEFEDHTVIIQFDPIRYAGAQLRIATNGDMELEEMEFEAGLPDQLKCDGYRESSPFEFHILINGLK